ncbi:MAG: alpha/beta fold hydrolase [Nocardiopsaceae bacterium]|jgi:alpha-beta hydrolase superfamily lysophospholipase|nr:alpha/beta fold hydrolase [Nocardiopsaceae bacterium]
MLLIHGLWFHPDVWISWLEELDEAGYDAVVLSWGGGNRSADDGPPTVEPGFDALLGAAKRHVGAFRPRPIVIGHGVGGAVAERLLNDGDAAAAISLAPVPGGYPAIPTVAHLLRHSSRLALLSLHSSAVAPPFPQFWRAIGSVSSNADARDFYEKYVVADKPRPVLLRVVRHRTRARSRQRQRGPLLLAAGGKDALIRETSIAALHRDYRRRQPDAVTDYKVFPGMDHTLGLGTQDVVVLFYCLDWLTAQNL